jgi:hypothetical protein
MTGTIDLQPKPTLKNIRPVIVPIGPSIAYVELTRGYFSLIDSDDALLAGLYNWRAVKGDATVYARTNILGLDTRLHALLCGRGSDHRNHNGLDNRCSANLRPATLSQNNCNRRRQKNNSSGYKGVSWHQGRRRWEANIQINGKRKDLGGFPTAKAAYEAYCHAAAQLHGEFARVA